MFRDVSGGTRGIALARQLCQGSINQEDSISTLSCMRISLIERYFAD